MRPTDRVGACGQICVKSSPFLENFQACAQLRYELGHIQQAYGMTLDLGKISLKHAYLIGF